jgi:Plasmid pRiA4b ORF-3-like protein
MNVQDLHSIYQLRIELRGIRPPIWRRLKVRNSTNLADLHIFLQIAMGWEDCHMHQFFCDGVAYGMSDEMQYEMDFRISQLLKKEGDSLLYEYDFGDGWQHELKLERISPFETDQVLPLCVGGKRGGPPEDIGGIPGYEMCLNALANRDDPANEELLEFVVEDFDPDYFDANDVNEDLRQYEKGI